MTDNPDTPITLDSAAGQILERLAILGILDAEQFPELSRYTRDQAVAQLTRTGLDRHPQPGRLPARRSHSVVSR